MPCSSLLYYNQPADARLAAQKENPKKGKSREPALPPLPEHGFSKKKKKRKK